MSETIKHVNVPTAALLDHAITLAIETASWDATPTVHEGIEVDRFDLRNVDFKEIEAVNENQVRFWGTVETTWSEKVARARRNPPGKAHPAEYETHDALIGVEILLDLNGLGNAEVHTEILDF